MATQGDAIAEAVAGRLIPAVLELGGKNAMIVCADADLAFVLKKHAADFIGIQETRFLLTQMESRFPDLVKEAQRVLPVRITEMTVTEEAHDNLLTAVRAKVQLSMHVLSYHDLHPTDPGWALFLVNQVVKEALATTNTAWSVAHAGASLKVF